MKRILFSAIIVILLAIGFSSCTTYDEGPAFSLLSPEMRIKGTWKQSALYINSSIQEDGFKMEFVLNSDGTGVRTSTLASIVTDYDIEWKLDEEKTSFLFKNTGATEWDDAKILRLTKNELWLLEDSGIFGMWEFRYEKQ